MVCIVHFIPAECGALAGIILSMRLANERQRYIATSSLIGRAQTQNDPCLSIYYTLMMID